MRHATERLTIFHGTCPGWNAAVQSTPAGESAMLCPAVLQFHCTRTLHVEEWQEEKMQAERGRERVLAVSLPDPPRPTGDAMRNMLLRDFYGYEFRFARNQGNRAMGVPHYDDKQVVKCACRAWAASTNIHEG